MISYIIYVYMYPICFGHIIVPKRKARRPPAQPASCQQPAGQPARRSPADRQASVEPWGLTQLLQVPIVP